MLLQRKSRRRKPNKRKSSKRKSRRATRSKKYRSSESLETWWKNEWINEDSFRPELSTLELQALQSFIEENKHKIEGIPSHENRMCVLMDLKKQFLLRIRPFSTDLSTHFVPIHDNLDEEEFDDLDEEVFHFIGSDVSHAREETSNLFRPVSR